MDCKHDLLQIVGETLEMTSLDGLRRQECVSNQSIQ